MALYGFAGQTFWQAPQPMQAVVSTTAIIGDVLPRYPDGGNGRGFRLMVCLGHTCAQAPQPIQLATSTRA